MKINRTFIYLLVSVVVGALLLLLLNRAYLPLKNGFFGLKFSDTKITSNSTSINFNHNTDNPVTKENEKAGTSDWIIVKPVSNHQIEGYSSVTSVSAGGTVRFYVNTDTPTFNADIYRMGYYHGKGAVKVKTLQNIKGKSYPLPTVDPKTGFTEEDWSESFNIQVPQDWLSGVYLVKLTSSNGFQSYIQFVVIQPSRRSDIVFIRAVTTDQAYNVWGGASLYGGPVAHNLADSRAVKVSFNRPYAQDYGAGQFFWWEYPMVRFLEKDGYDVSYLTDIDEHEYPTYLLNHKVIVITGHDEYWSKQMRDGVERAVANGVSLAVFAANTSFWQIRFESGGFSNRSQDRTEVSYKIDQNDKIQQFDPIYNIDKSQVTTQWRSSPVNKPEQLLLGEMYEDVLRYQGPFPWVVKNANSWVFFGTGLKSGDQIPNLVGYEYDRVFNNKELPANLEILSASPVIPGKNTPLHKSLSNSVVFTTASNSWIFDAGTVQWSWGLDDYLPPFSTPQPPYLRKTINRSGIVNQTIQVITTNILNKFISK